MTGISQLFKQFKRDIKASTGTDYTATVTRVEGGIAYVQLTGSDIPDTPATLSVDARPGDKVRVRVRNGKAWVNGNDTLPPSNDKKEVATKMSKDMQNRDKHIVIRDGVIKFVGDTLVVESKNFQLDEVGNATFSGTLNAAGGTFDGTMQFINSNRGTDDAVEIGPDAGASIIITNDSATLGHAEASIGARYIEIQETDVGTGDANAFISGSMVKVAQEDVGASSMLQANRLMIVYGSQSCYVDVAGVHTSSDERLKSHVTDVDPSTILKLRPVEFRFKSDPTVKHYGFIAQEVKQIMPDVVAEAEDGYLGLNYTEMIAPAIAAIQKQEERIATLERKLKEI